MRYSAIAVSAIAVSALLSLSSLTAATGAYKSITNQACTIVGTAKSEVIKGTAKADVICALGGNDIVYGLGGNDVLDGGTGNDKLYGGTGNDLIHGGSGTDYIDAGTGANKCTKESKESSSRTCSYVSALPKSSAPVASNSPTASPGSTSSPTPTKSPGANATPSPTSNSNSNSNSNTLATALTLDFETASSSQLIGFSGDTATIDNHPAGGASGSSRSVKIIRGNQTTSGTVFYTAASGVNLISSTMKTVSTNVYSPAAGVPVLLKLEDAADQSKYVETLAVTSGSGWQSMQFNFSNTRSGTPAYDSNVSYRKAVVFFDFGSTNSGATYFLDQVVFEAARDVAQTETNGFSVGSLLWSDEFDGTGSINASKWTARTCGHSASNGGGSCHNNEQQIYTPNAIALDGSGSAVVTTERLSASQSAGCLAWSAQCSFTSGRFDTQGKYSFQYGVLEARIKNPLGGANWPAFWLLGTNITQLNVGWPASGEIDVMEGKSRSLTSGAIHWSNSGADAYDYADYPGADFTSGYHIYKLYWLENYISIFVDGNKILEETPQSLSTSGAWAFNHPFFVILNNAVSPNGGFSGSYDGWTGSQMKIDYVRHYQLNGVGQVFAN
jgi:beta-glucanase (GH16 family)